MMRKLWVAVVLFALAGAAVAENVEVRGVQLPTRIELGGQPLVLNGAGVRQRLMFRVYVGALYLPQRTADAAAAMSMDGAKRVQMTMLRDVDADTLRTALREGFVNNLTEAELQALQPRIDAFAELISRGRKGDEVLLDYVPEQGTQVLLNGQQRGVIEGADFNRAVLGIWLGEKPADDGLKRAMLGG